ncbi:MAG: hypothetical protein KatS3mg108_2481 [Isosphaeraceae bacterium]|nr:MAG: hypothetical protein KatS3mg108_2481 [Isosphaeraceae bacterium]
MPSPRLLIAAGATLLATTSPTPAQYATSIPFSPYSRPYQSFSYPTIRNPSLPNQARLEAFGPALGGATTLDLPAAPDLFSIDPYGTLSRPTGSRFIPYHAAVRTPNRFDSPYLLRDQQFAENQARRDELYFQLRNERDPKRRTQLAEELARINQALQQAASTTRRNSPPQTTPATNNTPSTPSSRRTSRGTSLALPRSDQPSPPSSPPRTPPTTDTAPTTDTSPSIDPEAILERSRRLNPSPNLSPSQTSPLNLPNSTRSTPFPPSTTLSDPFRPAPNPLDSTNPFSSAPQPGTSRVRRPSTSTISPRR